MKLYRSLFLISLSAVLLALACTPRGQLRPGRGAGDVPQVKVLLQVLTGKDTLYFNQDFILHTEAAEYAFGRNNNMVVVERLEDGYKLFNDQRLFLFRKADVVRFSPQDQAAWFQLNGKRYAGEIIIKLDSEDRILMINRLDLEEYLASVVPAEIPSGQQSHIEAIKAQAICARTYALQRIRSRSQKEYHLYADVRDQAYGSLTGRTQWANQAIEETRGRVLVFKDSLADVYYHAHNGGIMEEDSVLWPGKNRPYLATRQDVIGTQLAGKGKPHFRWQQQRTAGQLDSLYRAFKGKSQKPDSVVDTLRIPYRFRVLKRSASGRVTELEVLYGDDTFVLRDYEIRRYLGWPPPRLLPSTLFYLSANDSALVIHGGGNGHGVGMSQWGAVDKAEKGLLFYHILESYFPGTRLKRIY